MLATQPSGTENFPHFICLASAPYHDLNPKKPRQINNRFGHCCVDNQVKLHVEVMKSSFRNFSLILDVYRSG